MPELFPAAGGQANNGNNTEYANGPISLDINSKNVYYAAEADL